MPRGPIDGILVDYELVVANTKSGKLPPRVDVMQHLRSWRWLSVSYRVPHVHAVDSPLNSAHVSPGKVVKCRHPVRGVNQFVAHPGLLLDEVTVDQAHAPNSSFPEIVLPTAEWVVASLVPVNRATFLNRMTQTKARFTRVKQTQEQAQGMEKFPLSCVCFTNFPVWTGCLRLLYTGEPGLSASPVFPFFPLRHIFSVRSVELAIGPKLVGSMSVGVAARGGEASPEAEQRGYPGQSFTPKSEAPVTVTISGELTQNLLTEGRGWGQKAPEQTSKQSATIVLERASKQPLQAKGATPIRGK